MAPTKTRRTYNQTKTSSASSQSNRILGNLLKRNFIKNLWTTNKETTDDSGNKESSFDKLLKTECFNKVKVTYFPENNLSNSCLSESSSLSTFNSKDAVDSVELSNEKMNEILRDKSVKIDFMNSLQLSPNLDNESNMKKLSNYRKRNRRCRNKLNFKNMTSPPSASKKLSFDEIHTNEQEASGHSSHERVSNSSSLNSIDIIESSINEQLLPIRNRYRKKMVTSTPKIMDIPKMKNDGSNKNNSGYKSSVRSKYVNKRHGRMKNQEREALVIIQSSSQIEDLQKNPNNLSRFVTKRRRKPNSSVEQIKLEENNSLGNSCDDIINPRKLLRVNLTRLAFSFNDESLLSNNSQKSNGSFHSCPENFESPKKIPFVNLTRLQFSSNEHNSSTGNSHNNLEDAIEISDISSEECMEDNPDKSSNITEIKSFYDLTTESESSDNNSMQVETSSVLYSLENMREYSCSNECTPEKQFKNNRKESNYQRQEIRNSMLNTKEKSHECSERCKCFSRKCIVLLNDDVCTKEIRNKDEKKKKSQLLQTSQAEFSAIEGEKSMDSRKKYKYFLPGKKFRRSVAVYKRAKKSLNKSGISTDDFRRSHEMTLINSILNVTELGSYIQNRSGYLSQREENLEEIQDNLANTHISVNESANDIAYRTAKDIVLRKCDQTCPLKFEECYPPSILRHCQKIGEGTFGEVFMYRDKDGSTTVMKIMPIEGTQIMNLEKQKTFEEILPEIIISLELSNLRKTKRCSTDGFVQVKKIRCVQGSYPERLLELWYLYQENKYSENDCPDIFQDDQLYIILELSNGGNDLEAFEFRNALKSLNVFKQMACSIAVAENSLRFEHRDLHWGNVLISYTDQEKFVYVLDGKEIVIENEKVKATIIDYTLSRIDYDGLVIFNDLSKEEDLFDAKGDYQFEIYREMRKKNGNNWKNFEPYTNLLWLHYILDKAISGFHYKSTKTKLHESSLKLLTDYKNKILFYDSVTDFVLNNF